MSGTPKPSAVPWRALFYQGGRITQEWVGFFRDIVSKKPQYDEVHLISTGTIYLGDSQTNGSWRIVRSGTDLHFDRRESAAWVNKGSFTA